MTESEQQTVTLIGERNSWHVGRIRSFLDRNIHPYRWVDADSLEGAALLQRIPEEARGLQPVVVFAGGSALAQPTNVKLAQRLGIARKPSREHYDLMIIGAGPAGLAAAVYGSSEGLSTVLIEREAPGGQAGQSSKIENYLGFHAGVSGADLAKEATLQARRFGTEFVQPTSAISLERKGEGHDVQLSDHTVLNARAVVIATGVEYRRLPVRGVAELLGAGVRYGAHPHDAADLIDKDVVIIGGANSAGQAAVHFSEPAHKVTMLVRARSLEKSMSRYLIEKIDTLPNVEVVTSSEVTEAHGDDRLDAISISRNGQPSAERLRADALFIFIGALPYTDWLEDTVARDERGFLLTGPDLMVGPPPLPWPLEREPHPLESSMPGVLVAGDARHGSIKRVASAVGEGSMAVQLIHQYLAEPE